MTDYAHMDRSELIAELNRVKTEDQQTEAEGLADRLDALYAEIEELRHNERCFRELAEHIREVFWMTDVECTELIYVSPAYEHIWGQTCQSLYDDPTSRLHWVHEDDRERVLHAFKNYAASGDYDVMFRIQRPDGDIRWIRDRAYPVEDEDGQVYRLAGFAIDVTRHQEDRENTQRLHMRLAQFDRLSAVGALGSGLAHEISQPLTAARTYLSQGRGMLGNNGDRNERLASLLARSETEIARAGDVVGHLRHFVRYGQPNCDEHDLRALINEVLSLLEPRMRSERVRTEVDLDGGADGDALRAWVDPVFLQQILFNLMGNAMDAMAGQDADQRRIGIQGRADDGRIRVRISDNGDGVDPESRERLFDPFYTSKPDGVGLGLAVSRSLADAHGGKLDLEEGEGPGTTFVLSLPERPAT